MKVMTWNVLHRVHAENYAEPVARRWPDERARAKAIAQVISAAVTVEQCAVVMLQEVSGDTLAAIREVLPSSLKAESLQSPRVPKFKRPTTTLLDDPSEHVVVVGPASMTVLKRATATTDAGKGFIAAQVAERLVVISTHVSFGPAGDAQMAMLKQASGELSKTNALVIGGDFNAERARVLSGLGADAVISKLPSESRRTRENPKGEGQDIDHLVCVNATLRSVQVAAHEGLSDHLPLSGLVVPS